jgi:copper oxidase (laccase) domain-containing protein
METRSANGLTYHVFHLFQPYPELVHGVFTRRGPDGGDFNLSFEHGDKETVLKNLTLAENALGLPKASFLNQGHGDGILELSPGETFAPGSEAESGKDRDALIGREGHNLMIKLADCQGAVMYSPDRGVLALVHSGWRGSALNILGKTVRRLAEAHGVDPRKLLCGITPSIGPCCMEFKSWRESLPPALWKYRTGEDDRFDFWAASLDQLTEAGLDPENVEIAGVCTRHGTEFYSHRAGDKGRFAVMAGIVRV